MWQPMATAPFDRDLELAVIDVTGEHALVFPCRRSILDGWINTTTGKRVDLHELARGEEVNLSRRAPSAPSLAARPLARRAAD
jgi:hypothetical protein